MQNEMTQRLAAIQKSIENISESNRNNQHRTRSRFRSRFRFQSQKRIHGAAPNVLHTPIILLHSPDSSMHS